MASTSGSSVCKLARKAAFLIECSGQKFVEPVHHDQRSKVLALMSHAFPYSEQYRQCLVLRQVLQLTRPKILPWAHLSAQSQWSCQLRTDHLPLELWGNAMS